MCVILCTEIRGKQILAKNRDRLYKPYIEIIHEIVNGIEVAYIKDKQSGWIEGMNANGFGLVNCTLSNGDNKINKERLVKNNIIYKALTEKNIEEKFYEIINNSEKDYILEGHTILYKDKELIHFENNNNNEYVTEKIKNDKVYSNYGINLKKEGYTKCNKGMSAFLRRGIIKKELKDNKISSIDELIQLMNNNYDGLSKYYHPYRKTTRGQLILNMTDLEFYYYSDVYNSERVTYINRLPKEYTPNIRIIIKETKKKTTCPKRIFTKKYLKKIKERFDCKTKKIKTINEI